MDNALRYSQSNILAFYTLYRPPKLSVGPALHKAPVICDRKTQLMANERNGPYDLLNEPTSRPKNDSNLTKDLPLLVAQFPANEERLPDELVPLLGLDPTDPLGQLAEQQLRRHVCRRRLKLQGLQGLGEMGGRWRLDLWARSASKLGEPRGEDLVQQEVDQNEPVLLTAEPRIEVSLVQRIVRTFQLLEKGGQFQLPVVQAGQGFERADSFFRFRQHGELASEAVKKKEEAPYIFLIGQKWRTAIIAGSKSYKTVLTLKQQRAGRQGQVEQGQTAQVLSSLYILKP